MPLAATCGISNPFGLLSPASGQIAHVLRDRSPLEPKLPFDLHFLGTPQAFVLSQDQTLHRWYLFKLAEANLIGEFCAFNDSETISAFLAGSRPANQHP
jgi:hypothetical protein